MPLAVNLKLIGDAGLNRKLQKLTNAIQKKVIRQALREAAKPLFKEIKSRVPVDEEDPQTQGRLKRSGKLRALTRSRKRIGVQITFGGDDAPYAAHVELGTQGNRADPFMREPAERYRKVFPKVVGRAARGKIEQIARKK